MTLKDLTNYLNLRPIVRPINRKNRTLIVVSDSKGSRLQNCVSNKYPENEIIWQAKGGRNSFQAANFVEDNLSDFVHQYGPILLVIWTGTCDLTKFSQTSNFNAHNARQRRKRYIELSSISVGDIIQQYNRILCAATKYGSNVKVVFLECPQYSIKNWNENQGHPDFESFQYCTEILLRKIENLNSQIQLLNHTYGISAPKFGLDLLKTRKSNKKYQSTTVSFSLLTDGIHPNTILSQYWLQRIVHTLLIPQCHD